MGLFRKSVTDEEWLNQAKPPYQDLLPLTKALHEAINSDSMEDEYQAVNEFSKKIPVIAEAVKKLPNPTSSEARRANKHLKSAIKTYTEVLKHGVKYHKVLYGEQGRNIGSGGMLERLAAGTIAFEKSIYTGFLKTAQELMDEASGYLGNQ